MMSPFFFLILNILFVSATSSTIDDLFSYDVSAISDNGSDMKFLPLDDTFADIEVALTDPGYQSTLNDDIFTDYNLATDYSEECSTLSSPSRGKQKIRVREEAQCQNPAATQNEESAATLKAKAQDYWCSQTAMAGFGNIPVCEDSPLHTIPSEVSLNPNAAPPYPDFSGFQTLLSCRLINPWDWNQCTPARVFCCNAWLASTISHASAADWTEDDGWGYWCWPSARSPLFPLQPPIAPPPSPKL